MKDSTSPEAARRILAACPMFTTVDEPSLGKLLGIARVRRYDTGEMVAHQGDETPGMFIVASGLVKVFQLAPDGKEHILHLVEAGGTFLEVAVYARMPCPASVQALESTAVLLLPALALLKLLADDHALSLRMLMGMSMWVKRLVEMNTDLALRDASGRVARYLLNLCETGDEATLPIAQKDLARHLNLTGETVSRTLARLESAGWIALGRQRHVRLLNRAGLRSALDSGGALV